MGDPGATGDVRIAATLADLILRVTVIVVGGLVVNLGCSVGLRTSRAAGSGGRAALLIGGALMALGVLLIVRAAWSVLAR